MSRQPRSPLDEADEKSSARMRAVGQANTAPEIRLRRELHGMGLRYRLHSPVEGVRPDVVFTRARVAMFVDGCFWHGCPIHYRIPVRNTEFWRERMASNQARDRRNDESLTASGCLVVRLWSHEIDTDCRDAAHRVVQAVRERLA
jgi:DNA mismatch endonuclease (patch repair protein)